MLLLLYSVLVLLLLCSSPCAVCCPVATCAAHVVGITYYVVEVTDYVLVMQQTSLLIQLRLLTICTADSATTYALSVTEYTIDDPVRVS